MKIRNYEIFKKHADLCRVLGSTNRLAIMELLDDGEMSVGDIADGIGAAISTTSQHLRILRDNNVVLTRRDGQTIYYRLKNPELLKACRLIRKVILDDMITTGEVAEAVHPDYQGA
jgi:ArsR family transcriptional regulator, virulence genes transcriptional regulator